MSLFDLFRKKKRLPSKAEGKPKKEKELSAKTIKKEPKAPVREVAEKKAAPPSVKQPSKKDFSEVVIKCLVAPHITEKATDLSEERKYVFKVKRKTNKREIRKAIQELYGARVKDVNIINVPRKPRRLGKSEGYKSGYKKAIVTLAEGEKIEAMPK